MHLRNFKTFTRLCLVCFGLCFAGTLSSQLYENVTPTKSDQLTKGIVFEIKSEKLTQLSQSKSNTLEIALPSMGQDEFLLDLEPIRIHSDGFSVVEKSKTGEKTIDYKTGQYYKGQLKGNNNS